MKSSIVACVVLSAFSLYACSSSDNPAATGTPDSDSGAGGSNTSGRSNGGAKTGGATNGGAKTGGAANGGASGGGTANGGTSGGGAGGSANGGTSSGGAGGSANGGASPDGSVPDGSAGDAATDSGPGPQCITIDMKNPDNCNKGVKIKDSCPSGRVVTNLTRCSDGTSFAPDSSYQEFTISVCPDAGCATDGNHTVWRKVECCYPVAGGDAGDGGGNPTDASGGD